MCLFDQRLSPPQTIYFLRAGTGLFLPIMASQMPRRAPDIIGSLSSGTQRVGHTDRWRHRQTDLLSMQHTILHSNTTDAIVMLTKTYAPFSNHDAKVKIRISKPEPGSPPSNNTCWWLATLSPPPWKSPLLKGKIFLSPNMSTCCLYKWNNTILSNYRS